jgi:hypothetical protein
MEELCCRKSQRTTTNALIYNLVPACIGCCSSMVSLLAWSGPGRWPTRSGHIVSRSSHQYVPPKSHHNGRPGLSCSISVEPSSLGRFWTADERRVMSNGLGNHAEGFCLKRLTETGADNSTCRDVKLQKDVVRNKVALKHRD